MYKIPTYEELETKRAISEESLREDMKDWGDWLQEDEDGLYTFESKIVKYQLAPEKGEKIYIEDFYKMLESKIIECYHKANIILEMACKDETNGIDKAFKLIAIEAMLEILYAYHNYPLDCECFFTETRLNEIIKEEMRNMSYMEYLQNLSLGQKTPLGVGSMINAMFCDCVTNSTSLFFSGVDKETLTKNSLCG